MSSEVVPRVSIRRATAADAPVLLQLAGRLANFDLPPWRTASEVTGADGQAMLAAVAAAREDDQVLLAEQRDRIVGCLHIVEVTDFFGLRHAHVSVIAIAEATEGTGVGRVLMQAAEGWARERGLPILTLNVFAANARARRFYEAAGFIPETLRYVKALQ